MLYVWTILSDFILLYFSGTASATINRDRLESKTDSLGKKSRSSGGFPDASQDPLDYDSDTARKHSFVIVQPQLKSEDVSTHSTHSKSKHSHSF